MLLSTRSMQIVVLIVVHVLVFAQLEQSLSPYSEDEAARVLAEHDILVKVDMGTGDASAKAWGCDLTYDYVKINGDYRT